MSQPRRMNHYEIITLKQSAKHWKYDMEWNSFALEVSPRAEIVTYLKSLISVCEEMVVVGSPFPRHDERVVVIDRT